MQRRAVVRLLALATAGLAGCTGSDEERDPPPTRPTESVPTMSASTATPSPTRTPISTPTPSPHVEELYPDIGAARVYEGDDGRVTVSTPVTNTVDRTVAADLLVTIETDREHTTRRRVTVQSGATETFTVAFDLDWSTVEDPRIRAIQPIEPGETL